MKSVLLFLILSSSAFANEKLCEYMERNQFKSMVQNTPDRENTAYVTLINKVSVDVEAARVERCASGGGMWLTDPDRCSSKCIEENETESSIEAVMLGNGDADFKKETRKCQALCHSYMQVARAYQEGLAAAGTSSPDCHQAVSHSERDNNKSDLIDVVSRLPRQGGGSRQ